MNSIQNEGFSLEIMVDNRLVEKVIYKNSNYYSVPQGTPYSVRLTNDRPTRADAYLWISGRKAGVYRINPYSRVTVSKYSPSGEPFVAWDTTRIPGPHKMSVYHPWGTLDNLVQVRFVPEKNAPIVGAQGYTTPDWLLYRYECSEYTDGVTPFDANHRKCALTAEEYERLVEPNALKDRRERELPQRFQMRRPLEEVDDRDVRTIMTRVIVDNDQRRYRRDQEIWRNASNPDSAPPRLTLRYPDRPHTCHTDSPFTLSRKFYFDSY